MVFIILWYNYPEKKKISSRQSTKQKTKLFLWLSLLIKLLFLGLNTLLLSKRSHPLSNFSIKVQLQHNIEVLKRVLLNSCSPYIILDWLHNRLNLIKRPINRIELFKSRFGPNLEPFKMPTRHNFYDSMESVKMKKNRRRIQGATAPPSQQRHCLEMVLLVPNLLVVDEGFLNHCPHLGSFFLRYKLLSCLSSPTFWGGADSTTPPSSPHRRKLQLPRLRLRTFFWLVFEQYNPN